VTNRGFFLDRDGVINHEIGYLSRIAEVVFVDGIFSLCRTALSLGYRLFIVTNQAGIARGFYTEADYQMLMEWMCAQFVREGIEFSGIYHCPFHPEHGIGEYKREHEDRKPGTGMLRRGAREFSLDLTQSILVGDRCSDIAAANSASLRQAFLMAGTETTPCPGHYLPVTTLREVEQWLLDEEQKTSATES